jgi:DNA-binding NarL/FixJ family response regulator
VLRLTLPLYAAANARSEPGVIILDLKKQITFANQIALETFNSDSATGHCKYCHCHFNLPDEISLIHAELKSKSKRLVLNSFPEAAYIKKFIQIRDSFFMIRAFVISDSKSRPSAYFLFLLDKQSNRAEIDLELARVYFHLSLKEFDVVQLLVGGLTNKEIGHKLGIAECTVKEYLRKVMGKVGAGTRCGVVAQVLSLPDRKPGKGAPNAENALSPALMSRVSSLESPELETYTILNQP